MRDLITDGFYGVLPNHPPQHLTLAVMQHGINVFIPQTVE